MSYYLTISGHKDGLTTDETKAFETAVVDKARAFVASLEGVTSATANASTLITADLLAPPAESELAPEAHAGLEPVAGGEAV